MTTRPYPSATHATGPRWPAIPTAWAVEGNDKAYVEGSTLIIPAGSVGDIEVVPNFGTIPYDIIFAETKEGTVSSEVSTYRVSDSVQIIKVTPEPADGYVIDLSRQLRQHRRLR